MQIKLKLNKKYSFTRRIRNDCEEKFTKWLSKNNLDTSEIGKKETTFTFLDRKAYQKAVSSFKKLLV